MFAKILDLRYLIKKNFLNILKNSTKKPTKFLTIKIIPKIILKIDSGCIKKSDEIFGLSLMSDELPEYLHP